MKNDLSCDVVKDLLPSYIDELTSADSNKAVGEHLSKCESCREAYKAMCPDKESAEANIQKEVDYLKSIKKKNGKKIRTAVLWTMGSLLVAFVVFIATMLFIVGKPVNGYTDRPAVTEKDGILYLEFHNPNSAYSYAHWKIDYTDPSGGKGYEQSCNVKISARAPMRSFFYPSGDNVIKIDLTDVDSVSFMGFLLWQDGLIIRPEAEQIFSHQRPYAGSAPDMGFVLGALKLPSKDATSSIQSDSEPYGWTIHYKQPLNAIDEFQVTQNAPIILALVDNLGEFGFTYPDGNGGEIEHCFSVDDANELLPKLYDEYNQKNGTDWEPLDSIKDYTDSIYYFQQLLDVLDY